VGVKVRFFRGVRFYDGHLQQHILPFLGQRATCDLRRSDRRDLVTLYRTKGLKVTAVRGIARTLSTILTQAVEDELLTAHPAFRLRRSLRTADDAEPGGSHQMRPFASLLLQEGAPSRT
jgi:hypothetical protein